MTTIPPAPEHPNTTTPPATPIVEGLAPSPAPAPGRAFLQPHALAVTSGVATILAWLSLYLSGWLSLGLCAVAIVAGAFACRQPRGNSRNLAITSIITSGVLFLVLAVVLIILLKLT